MEWRIARGIITETKKKLKGLGSDDFSLIFKKLLTKFKVPYHDECCESNDHISPVQWNNLTDRLEKLDDPIEHTFTPVPLYPFPFQVRVNPYQGNIEYWNADTSTWVVFEVIGSTTEPQEGIQFNSTSLLTFDDGTILTF